MQSIRITQWVQKIPHKRSFVQLSESEQDEIAILLSKGYSERKIAFALTRDASTISREINKNSVLNKETWEKEYIPKKARMKRYQRRKYCKIYLKKIREHPDLEKYVRKKLQEEDWSPETISTLWNQEHPESTISISAKTIYEYCYSAFGQDLCSHLYKKRFKAKRQGHQKGSGRFQKVLIPERVWIEERPKETTERTRIWDTESDFIVSRKGDNTALTTNIDRNSRYLQARLISERTCTKANTALQSMLSFYNTPTTKIHSVTLDNDIAFQHHTKLRDNLGIHTYFCHPFHSWEKGQIEYANRMIRRYIPKKSLLRNISQKEIDKILKKINNTPRKCPYPPPSSATLGGFLISLSV